MRYFTRPGILLLLAVFVTACVNAPGILGAPPTTAVGAETLLSATLPPSASTAAELANAPPTPDHVSAPDTFTVGDMDFLAKEVKLGSAYVAVADFNADGIPDLVSGSEPELTIFIGDGTGGFTATSRAPGGPEPDGIATGDLDQDGDIDLAVANHDTHFLTLLLGDGQGSFQPAPNSPLQINVSPHPHVVKAIDIDLDDILDLVVDHRDGNGVLMLRGLGEGVFETPGLLEFSGGDPYRGIAIGDINADGRPDLLTPNPDEVGVLINNGRTGQNTFTLASPVSVQAPFAVELADFNGDGLLDLIAASDEGSPLVQLFNGNGQGGFNQAVYFPIRFAPGAKNIAVGDFNADGFSDAAVASYHHANVLVVLGGKQSIATGNLPGGEHPWGLAVADFNQDGRDDLLVADDGSLTAALFLSRNSK